MQLVAQTSRRLNELEDLLRQDSNDNSDDSEEEKNAHTVGHGAGGALLSERTDALEERIGWLLRQADLVDGLQKSLELHHEVRLKRNTREERGRRIDIEKYVFCVSSPSSLRFASFRLTLRSV